MEKKFAAILYIFFVVINFFIARINTEYLISKRIIYASEIQDVVINEIAWMGNKISSADEWIEIYNNQEKEVNLTGWKLKAKDGKPEIMLEGIINAHSYYLIERTDDTAVKEIKADLITSFDNGLNNQGEVLELYDMDGKLVDSTPYVEEWVAGDNMEKYTMERINPLIAGEDKDNWKSSKVSEGTPKAVNSLFSNENLVIDKLSSSSTTILLPQNQLPEAQNFNALNQEEDASSKEVKGDKKDSMVKKDEDNSNNKNKSIKTDILAKAKILPGKIIISEIYPNPLGIDFKDEFIELKNIGGQEINIEDWIIKTKSGEYKIARSCTPVTIIPVGGFFFLPRSITEIALDNNDDQVLIFSNNGEKIDSVLYKEYALEGASYINSKFEQNSKNWQWTMTVSPGGDNIFIPPNRPPIARIDSRGLTQAFVNEEITFDGSDSFDPDGDNLSYLWKINDGTEEKNVVIKKRFPAPGNYEVSLKVKDNENNGNSIKYKIKILKNEWEENVPLAPSNTNLNLQSEAVTYQAQWENITIAKAFPYPSSNDTEWIELFNNEDYSVSLAGWVIDDQEGGSSSYQIPVDVIIGAHNSFRFPKDLTGIALNNSGDEIRLFNSAGTLVDALKYEKIKQGEIVARGNLVEEKNPGDTERVGGEGNEIKSWEDLERLKNKKVVAKGKVSVEPFVLGKQIFYISNDFYGLRVFCFKKDFPELERGDYISVSGLLDEDGRELKIEGQKDIQVISFEHPPLAQGKEIKEINDQDLNTLINLKGRVLEKKLPNIYIEDKNGEMRVYIKEGVKIEAKNLKSGNEISVIGILDYINGEYRLLPRDQEDLQIISTGQVLGVENTETSEAPTSLSENPLEGGQTKSLEPLPKTRQNLVVYLSISAIVILIMGVMVWRKII